MVCGRDLEDRVTHPSHYTSHPSGIECIEVTQDLNFCLGNAIKYIWRAGLKSDNVVEDLSKAIWYLEREISRISEVSNDEAEDPLATLRDFFDDDDTEDTDGDEDCAPVDWDKLRDEDDESDYFCGEYSCDCDGSCFDSGEDSDDEDEATAQHRDTYSDGRQRVTVAELRERLAGDATGEDPLQLLVTSILYHTLTDNLPDAFAADAD